MTEGRPTIEPAPLDLPPLPDRHEEPSPTQPAAEGNLTGAAPSSRRSKPLILAALTCLLTTSAVVAFTLSQASGPETPVEVRPPVTAENAESEPNPETTPPTRAGTTTERPAITISVTGTSSSTSMQAPDPVEPIAWTLDDLGGFGSGCTPGTAASLPDGTWAGFVELAGTGISFDLACVSLVNAGDGTPHPSIENNNPMLRLLNVGPDLLVIDARDGSGQARAIPLEELGASYHSEAVIDRLVFVQVSGGVVTVIQLPSVPPNG